MPEFIVIPNFTNYKINKYGSVVRIEDGYEPLVSLDFEVKLYNGEEQQEINVLPIVRRLFPEESANINYGTARNVTHRQQQQNTAFTTPITPITTPSRPSTAITSAPSNIEEEFIFHEIIRLNTYKHFKAYILRGLGWSRARIAAFLFNGNSGAARNAEILYTTRPLIIIESARRLGIGRSSYELLQSRVGNGILPNIYL